MCLVVSTLVGWGGLGWAAHLCSTWSLLSGGRQTGYQSTSGLSLCSDPIGQSRSHDQADVSGSESAVLCRAGRVGGERLRNLKHPVFYACLSVFF